MRGDLGQGKGHLGRRSGEDGVKPWDPGVEGGAELSELLSGTGRGGGLGAAGGGGLLKKEGGRRDVKWSLWNWRIPKGGSGAAARGLGAIGCGLWSEGSKEEEKSEQGSGDILLGGWGPGWAKSI